MSRLTVPQNQDKIRTLQPKLRKVEPAHDDGDLSSADENYHFIKLTEKPNGKKLRYQPLRSEHRRNQSQQQQITNNMKLQNMEQLPDILYANSNTVRMRPVDFDKIYSQEEKDTNAKLIGIFFDKYRKLKRHANGTMLIRRFVSPIYSSLKLRNLSKEQKETKEKAIERSYESDRHSQNRSKYAASVTQSKDSQFLFGKQNEVFHSTYIERIEPSHIYQNYDDDDQNNNENEYSNENEKNNDNENYNQVVASNDYNDEQEKLNALKHSSIRKMPAQSPKMYEKDYTRIQIIKERSKNISFTGRSNKNYITQQYSNLANSIQDQKSTAGNSVNNSRDNRVTFSDQKEEMRIIAPFVENHFRSMSNKEEVLMAHDFKMKKIQQKKQTYIQQWDNFENQTQHYSNFLANAGHDKSQNFKLVGLRKQFDSGFY
ncbi:UNKNOWN [Stylonychia lemnae]|uniref:Uncharacterized protein n=1 Tax=Stylonychia lemnae TaxID=5949 RepID=A0A078A417_STYLE|nr:UNKNOWN [Stylonychia lemnae]|eukprot:CDW76268.1 UNKNOWN [Stylonychia lemnae]